VGLHDRLADDRPGLVRGEGGGEVLAQFARDDLDGPLTGDLPGGLPAHAVGDHADGHVRELLDLDGVLVVLAVVPQKGALADVQCHGHEATSFSAYLPWRAAGVDGKAARPAPAPEPARGPERTDSTGYHTRRCVG